MVLYQCEHCSFETKDKGKFTRHCNRKFPCKKKEKIDIKQSTEPEKDEITQNYSKITQNCSFLLKNCSISDDTPKPVSIEPFRENVKTISMSCDYCYKIFNRKFNYERHIKSCKVRKSKQVEINQKFLQIKDLEEKTTVERFFSEMDDIPNLITIINLKKKDE